MLNATPQEQIFPEILVWFFRVPKNGTGEIEICDQPNKCLQATPEDCLTFLIITFMKNLSIFLLAAFLASQLPAQTLTSYCWDFEEECSVAPSNPFYALCIPFATSSHGTPSNPLPNSNEPAAPSGSRYARMYTFYHTPCPDNTGFRGEGFLLHANFAPNKTYKVRFTARTKYPGNYLDQMSLYLVNNMPNAFGGNNISGCSIEDRIPAVPAGSSLVGTYNGNTITHDLWKSFEAFITPGTAFNQLWFRPIRTGGTSGEGNIWFVDNVCVEEIQCPDASFSLSLCKVEYDDVRVTVDPQTTMGTWQLFQALDCDGGTDPSNIGAPVAINWLDPAQTMFEVPFWTGCYILQYTIPAANGCPPSVHRELFDSKYAGRYAVTGEFDLIYVTECAAPTYDMYFIPEDYDFANDMHYWVLYDLSNPTVPIGTWNSIVVGLLTLDYGKAYRMEHWQTRTINGYCLISRVHWEVFGCGMGEASGPTSGSYSSANGFIPPGENSEAGSGVSGRNALANQQPGRNAILFPNPVSTSNVLLQTNVAEGEAYQVAIFNATGQLVKQYSNITDAELIIEHGTLQAGTHMVQVQFADGRRETLKLVVL